MTSPVRGYKGVRIEGFNRKDQNEIPSPAPGYQ